jgi:hypothetical protein
MKYLNFICAGAFILLTSCNSHEEKRLSLKDLIIGDWSVEEIKLNGGIAEIDLYHLIRNEDIPAFQFTEDSHFTVFNNKGISYISGDYDISGEELILKGQLKGAEGEDTTLNFPVQINNSHQIIVTGSFRTHFLALMQRDPQIASSLLLALNILGNLQDATINLVLQRQ